MRQGKLIALYGINNLGKTTQAKRLVARIQEEGPRQHNQVLRMKFPLYEHEPTGPIINSYLREGNPFELDATGFQIVQCANRLHFDPSMKVAMEMGIWVVAEDYRGTGLAWGIGKGVNRVLLETLNASLVPEDLAILMDGERFRDAIEGGHRHEQDDDLTKKVRAVHLELASQNGWIVVNTNRPEEVVHEEIWSIVSSKFLKEAVI